MKQKIIILLFIAILQNAFSTESLTIHTNVQVSFAIREYPSGTGAYDKEVYLLLKGPVVEKYVFITDYKYGEEVTFFLFDNNKGSSPLPWWARIKDDSLKICFTAWWAGEGISYYASLAGQKIKLFRLIVGEGIMTDQGYIDEEDWLEEILSVTVAENKKISFDAEQQIKIADYTRDLKLLPERQYGEDIKYLQFSMNIHPASKKLEAIDIDGWFGPATEKRVKLFQKHWGLKETGIVDDGLWKRITMTKE